ncbi:hypothetical protein ATCV1_z820R [Acanthocystis turfacea chlorella virus 1]|uniref:Uncharacterized protein z820R n=1 Tax=Chlorovirus heliozoae TaxID=322019 RepID=A7KA80_9PHYC|nr:hypothetical protein ATCV1_z820R [Acanthocystis turfacea chlorella virus 1]ABT16954.1 hypothetical protein ATCV1_z820R [Acanthocystis turfacea chlorella virus 1]
MFNTSIMNTLDQLILGIDDFHDIYLATSRKVAIRIGFRVCPESRPNTLARLGKSNDRLETDLLRCLSVWKRHTRVPCAIGHDTGRRILTVLALGGRDHQLRIGHVQARGRIHVNLFLAVSPATATSHHPPVIAVEFGSLEFVPPDRDIDIIRGVSISYVVPDRNHKVRGAIYKGRARFLPPGRQNNACCHGSRDDTEEYKHKETVEFGDHF